MVLITITGSAEEVDLTINGGHLTDPALGTRVVRLGRPPESLDVLGLQKARDSRDAHRRNLKSQFDLGRLLDDRVNALGGEIAALRDLAELVRRGALQHLPGMAVSLRKLAVRGKGNQILRDVAAILRQSLIVYCGPPATRFPDPLPPPSHQLTKSLSVQISQGCTRKTDLECWLSEIGYSSQGKGRTNEKILADIADKIGAHSDYDVGKLIAFLRQLKLGEEQGIINFLMMVADATLNLGQALLNVERGEWGAD